MPTVLRIGPYRFYFYSHDGAEPRHIHVERDGQSAKFCSIRSAFIAVSRFLARSSDASSPWSENTLGRSGRSGMNSSARESLGRPLASHVSATDDDLVVELVDGRTITVPVGWFPRLAHGTPAERADWRLTGRGEGIHWPALDEDVSVLGLIAGRQSSESQASLERWLAARTA
jgi:hypothetical protein